MDSKTQHAIVTEEMLAEHRNRIGKIWVPDKPYCNTQAVADNIRKFAEGIGDDNPLFRDREYASKTKYGCMIAPPCFLMSVWWPGRATGLAGIHGWDSGKDFKFYKPIMEGDTITYTVTQTALNERESKIAGRIWEQHSDTVYKNQKGETIAICDGWTTRAERAAAGEKGKNRTTTKHITNPEELKGILADYDAEVVRGANPRYWEDVKEGDILTQVVKGPLTLRDMITWIMGAGSPFMKAHKRFYNFAREHQKAAMMDSTTGEMDAPELVHLEQTRAQEIGISAAYDYGAQRVSWLGNLLTNWMGDDAFLKKYRAELRRFNIIGDTTWLKGTVSKKYIDEDNEHCIDINCWAENQRKEITMPGFATIVLPSREEKNWPVLQRLTKG
ncbi:MaoC family dehydratase N-terminal domain-containing protein [Chloroflexota bacterium]